MMTLNAARRLIVAASLGLAALGAQAGSMSLAWFDPAGDGSPVGDVVAARLTFSSDGSWTATWTADPAHPFTGDARFNLNLYDTALGNLAAAAPQLNLDGSFDFGATTARTFSYSGSAPFLANWRVGDTVVNGNSDHFLSGVVGQANPYSRDDLLVSGAVITAVPEPASALLLLAGLGLLGAIAARPRLIRLRAGSAGAARKSAFPD